MRRRPFASLGDIDEFDVTDLLGSLVDKSLVVTEPVGAGGPLSAAGNHPSVQRRAPGRGRGRRPPRRARRTGVLPVPGGNRRPAPDRARDQAAGLRAAGRRPGELPPRRRARGRPAGGDRAGPAVRRRAVAVLAVPPRKEEAAGLLVPALRRPKAAADPALYAEALVVAASNYRPHGPARKPPARRAGRRGRRQARRRPAARPVARHLGFGYYCAGEPERARPPGPRKRSGGPATRRRRAARPVLDGEASRCRRGGGRAAVRRGFRLYRAFRPRQSNTFTTMPE